METTNSRQQLPINFGDSSTAQAFEYTRLQDTHVRLIHLNKGVRNDPLSLKILENVDLETTPVYEALSYTWGGSDKGRSISCDLGTFAISTNLATALVRLRTIDKGRTLWVDQICINQDHIDERSEQVTLMGRIYSQAENVIIWLGEEGPDDGMAFGFVPILLSYLPPSSTGNEVLRRGLVSRQALPIVGSPAWIALSRVFNRPYFRRSWIVQEVALARHAVVHCGPFMIEWSLLAAASRYQMGEPTSDTGNAHAAVAAITGLGCNDHCQGNSILDLLFMSYSFDCTDPKDKIFAMLGLAQEKILQPDYSSSVEDIYMHTARSLLLALGNLDLLCCVFHPKKLVTLPSWVPDWTAQVDIKRRLGKPQNTNLDIPHQQLRHSNIYLTLTLPGWCVGSVAKVADIFTPNKSCFDLTWNDFVDERARANGKSYTEIYRRTLLAGESLPGITSDEELHLAYEAWRNLINRGSGGGYKPITNEADENDKGTKFDRAMTEACIGRRLFTTAEHDLGLGPREAHVGDMVCVLDGTSTPFILRPRENHFELIGESYIQHLVDQDLSHPELTRTGEKREFSIQ